MELLRQLGGGGTGGPIRDTARAGDQAATNAPPHVLKSEPQLMSGSPKGQRAMRTVPKAGPRPVVDGAGALMADHSAQRRQLSVTSAGMPGPGRASTSVGDSRRPQVAHTVCSLTLPPQPAWV